MATSVLTTEQAFTELLNRPDLWRKTGRPLAQRQTLLYKLSQGKGVSLDNKEKMLTEAGYLTRQEKIWGLP